MVRVKGKDSLGDVDGTAVRAFNRAELSTWENRADLERIYTAAQKLQPLETAFNDRAHSAAPDLKKNLRAAEHMAAIRAFMEEKEILRKVHPHAAEHIARMVERDFNDARRRPAGKKLPANKLH